MKRLLTLFLVALLALVAGSVMAQDDGVEDDIIVIELPDVLVICPGQMVLPGVREAAELVVEFADLDDVLVIPVGVVEEVDGVTTVTIGRIQLTCDSTESIFSLIDRSPAVDPGEQAPQPENLQVIPETQSGYLVVLEQNVNLRSCDHPTCTQVALVHGGDYLIALGTNGETGDRLWWYVQVGDVFGWIWGDLVAGRGDLTDVPIIETDGEPTPPTVYVGFSGNPLYSDLSASATVVCNISTGDNFPLLGRNAIDETWYWIEATCLDGTVAQGWIAAEQVAVRNSGLVPVPIVGSAGP